MTSPDPAWQSRAACLGSNPDLFFPSLGESQAAAKAICARCEVRQSCLDHALDHGECWGIWGGLSEHERGRIRRARPPRSECVLCGGLFERRHPAERYCSDDCRDEGYAARHRLNRTPAPHGTVRRYKHQGCRCGDCRAAWAIEKRWQRREAS